MSDEIKQQFWKALAASPVVMIALDSHNGHSAPMRAQLDKDANGAFWFFTSRDNRIAAGGAAMAQFSAKGHDLFACISGTLTPDHDRATLERLWSNPVESWFTGGKDDPNLVLLRFDLGDAEIWTADIGVVGLFKMATGLTIKPGEAGNHAKVALA